MKKCLIIGGSGDIGSAIGAVFLKKNYTIVPTSSRELDLSSVVSINSFCALHENSEFESIILSSAFNNPKLFKDLTYKEIEDSLNINLLGFLKVLKRMQTQFLKTKTRKNIIILSSLYSSTARDGRLTYVVSKHALEGLVKTLAIEWGPLNCFVNSVSPGYIDTQMTQKNNSPQKILEFISKIPLKRLGKPKDIAEVVYFLCSSKNSYINGQNIVVDGGYSIGGFQSY